MALDKKISQLSPAASLGDADLFEIVQSGTNLKLTGTLARSEINYFTDDLTDLKPKVDGRHINLLSGSLKDDYVTAGIPLGESGETALSGFTNTSIVGALNELKTGATSATWDSVMHIGNTFTVLDTENLSATINQNDVTNNPAALVIANTGSGNDITLPNSSSIKNGSAILTAGLTVSALNTANGIVQTDGSGVFSTSVTLADGTLATTQSPSDNSTKIATTAYVEAAVTLEDLWDRSGTLLVPKNIGDGIELTIGKYISKDTITTVTPLCGLSMFSDTNHDNCSIFLQVNRPSADGPYLQSRKGRGSHDSPATTVADDNLFIITTDGYEGGGTYSEGARVSIQANENFSSGNNGSKIIHSIVKTGTASLLDMTELNDTGLEVNANGAFNMNDTADVLSGLTHGINLISETTSAKSSILLQKNEIGATETSYLTFRRGRGDYGTPATIITDDQIGVTSYEGYEGGAVYGTGIEVRGLANEGFSASALGSRLEWWLCKDTTDTLVEMMQLDGTGLTLESGTNVNEFSIDGTLVGNSDNAVPTEQAVKTYVDAQVGGVDEFIELTDTPSGYTTSNAIYTTNGTPDAVIETTVVLTEGTDTFNIAKGTASLDIAAGSALNVDANLTVESASIINQDVTSDADVTFNGATLSSLNTANGIVRTDGSGVLSSSTSLDVDNITLTNIETDNFKANVVDTDGTLAANSDTRFSSQKAIKTFVENAVVGLYWRPAVDLKDDAQTDAGSNIVGQTSYNADGIAIVNGDRLLLTAETTAPATYLNKVFLVGGVGSSITLTLETDGQAGDGSPTDGDTVYIQRGTTNADKKFSYTGTAWQLGASLDGALLATNNLSDVSSASTSATNLGLGTGDSPTFTGLTLSGLSDGLVKSVSGVLSGGNSVTLTSEVTGILPIANGGTNSSTALNNNFVMVSSGGSIVESSTITTTELGLLNGIASVSTGTGDNDKFVTQGYVDDAVGSYDTWDEIMHNGNTFTVLDTENLSATITQNDTTNNPAALIIANTGSGNDITLPNSSFIKNGAMTLNGNIDFASAGSRTIGASVGGNVLTLGGATTQVRVQSVLKVGSITNETAFLGITNEILIDVIGQRVQMDVIEELTSMHGVYIEDFKFSGTVLSMNSASLMSINNSGGGISIVAAGGPLSLTSGTGDVEVNDSIDLTSGNVYKINNVSVLSATTLGSAVVNSSLTSLGTLTSLDVDNVQIDGNTIDTTSGDLILDSTTNVIKIGSGETGIDYALSFIGESNTGTITFLEDENRFDFSDIIQVDYIYGNASAGVGMHIKNEATPGPITFETGSSGDINFLAPSGRCSFLGAKVRINDNGSVGGGGIVRTDNITNISGVDIGISASEDIIMTPGTEVRVESKFYATESQFVNITTVNAATYDLLVTDYILNVTYTGTGAVTSLTLPTAQTVSGRTIHIKDAGGNSGTNNITIDTEGSEDIDGEDTYVIDVDYDSITLYSDGSNWFTY